MGQTPWSAVINLSNSIIGVSVLAMPWCFKECGVVLAISLLIITGIVNKFSCNLLLRSSKATRKTSYETVAHHTLGGMGKLSVEVSVILLLMCTCIAFFVIIGDLGPSLVSKFAGIENTSNLRTFILLGTAVFIILPLAQKRNVESLSALSTISISFYFFFATSVFVDCIPRLISLEWVNNVAFWRPAGVLKGMSIFALSMCCQPTLFPIYNSLQERTPKMMEDVVSKGVNLVAFVYMVIGFFGYITYYTEGIKGDILLNQPPSLVSDGLKLCFALSVALSFPLCVFPCRASLFSLICPNADCNPITGMTYIPPTMFRIITVVILAITLTIAILIPNVEVVLSLTGSTMGSLACFILPALIYQHTVGVPTRFMPKVLLIIGICFMLFSTYDNVRPAPQDPNIPAPVPVFNQPDDILINKLDEVPIEKVAEKPGDGLANVVDKIGLQGDDINKEKDKELNVADIMAVKDTGEQSKEKDKGDEVKRQEPPIPHAPIEGALPDTKDKANEDVKEKNEVQLEVPDKKVEKEEAAEEEAAVPKEKHKKHKDEAEGDRDERDLGDADDAKKDSKDKEIAEETEEKFKVQEEKQEKQEKKLEELQARQVIQERLIVKQAEEIDQLKKEHEQEKQIEEDAAAQLAAQQAIGQVPQQPVVGGVQQQQPVAAQQVPGGQPVIGQPIDGQVGDQQAALGQLGVQQQQQPLAGQVPVQPVVQVAGQLPVVQQPAGQLPMAQQAVGQLPVAQQAAGQIPVAQQAAGQLPVAQGAGQLPVLQQAAGQLPVVQQVPGQLAGQQLQGQFAQQPLAAGQQGVQVGMQPVAKMVSMFPQGDGGMGQNLAIQQQGGVVGGLQHAGVEGINQVAGIEGVPPQQQQQQLMQGGVGLQGIQLDGAGMQAAVGGGGGAFGQANILQQANVPQQVPLALQQQQQFLQQPQQQQQLLQQPLQQQLLQQPPQQQQQVFMQQQQPVLVDQQQVPLQQQQVPLQQNQQPAMQVLPDADDGLQGGVAAMGQQPLQQQGMVPPGDGMANAGFVKQAQGGAMVDGGLPQQPQHVEPVDKMIKSVDKDAVLEPGNDLNLAGVQQRVLNQAEADGEKESEKQAKEEREEKHGESDGVIQIVGEEEKEEDEGNGGGDGDAVPNLEEAKGVAVEEEKKVEDQDLLRIEDKQREGDAERDIDGENENKEEKENEGNDKAPEDESEHEAQIEKVEDKLLENHLKMVEDKEEEFADQEDVFDIKEKDEDDEGKVEMNQEQNNLTKDKKKI
nr:putative sodium-coupled neutral amino acid transporter 10 isoform X1 [Lytechinus pictus]XP_054763009.1 putative sodium-coupled neutral amino acid transporter 10 isoform X1 [Lytechinus pictus]